MALREETVVDRMEILEDGQIQVRYNRRVYDGNELLAEKYHREVHTPDADTTKIVHPRLKAIAETIWTADVISEYVIAKAAQEAAFELQLGIDAKLVPDPK